MTGMKAIQFVGLVAVGVFFAGLAMNAMRDNDIVRSAIDGFDS